MDLNPVESITKKDEKKAWDQESYQRASWIKPTVQYGSTIAPPNDQKSNNHFEDSQVLQPREEAIGEGSQAFPISGRHDTGHGTTDDITPSKKSYPTGKGGLGAQS